MPLSTGVAPFIRFAPSPSSSPLHLRRLPASQTLPAFSLMSAASSLLRTLFPALRAACEWLRGPTLTLTLLPPTTPCRCVTVTFFGHRKGRISLAVQENPRSDLLLLLEFATPTCHLVKEMASGMVRILLESEHENSAAGAKKTDKKKNKKKNKALWEEPVWTMFCNGLRCGHAVARECTSADVRLLNAVSAVSVGAGVMTESSPVTALPSPDGESDSCLDRSGSQGSGSDGELMYMRAKFERVVGSKDSEALYMMNPDCGGKGNAGPELSIFLLRV